jgi:hypothetical protein
MPFSGLLCVLLVAEVSGFSETVCLSSLSASYTAMHGRRVLSELHKSSRSYGELQSITEN